MSLNPSIDEIRNTLIVSELVSDAELKSLLEELDEESRPTDGEALLRLLVEQSRITQYQAQVLKRGKGRSLRLGNYLIQNKLGQGGMGMVFHASHVSMKREVALKVVSPKVARNRELMQRFQREVEATAKLHHPNIVVAHDASEDAGTAYLVMEYIDGKDLSAIVKKKGPLAIPQAVNLIRQAAAGLEYAHAEGVIHRDIKPSNLFLDQSGTLKILDMGLARFENDESGELTATGAVMGTIDYMAPEQALNTKNANALSDVYSLGCTLWYLLLARPIFDGESMVAKILAHRTEATPSLMEEREDVPEELQAIFEKMVAKNPEQRYASMSELISDLEKFQSGDSDLSAMRSINSNEEDQLLGFLKEASVTAGNLGTGAVRSTEGSTEQEFQSYMLPPVVGRSSSAKRKKQAAWWQDWRILTTIGVGSSLIVMFAVFAGGGGSDSKSTETGEIPDETQQTSSAVREIVDTSEPNSATSTTGQTSDLQGGDVDAVKQSLGKTGGALTTDQTSGLEGWEPLVAVKPAVGENGDASTTGQALGWQGWPGDAPPPAIAPFDAAQAKAHQEAWAKYLGVPVEYTNSIGMKFRLIPPGEFLMGSTPEEIAAALNEIGESEHDRFQSECPQHQVILTQPLYVGVTEVTQAQYWQVVGTNPSNFSATGRGKNLVARLKTFNHPVEMVNWYDAAEFCAKLCQREQLKPFYLRAGDSVTSQKGTGYRLPSEAEWEYACRAGTTTRFWSGDQDKDLLRAGWFERNSGGRTHAVGELRANPFGLWDMHGNVWDWVQDGWDAGFYGRFSEKAAVDPSNPFSGVSRPVLRGGPWRNSAPFCRSSERGNASATGRAFAVGFRVVLMVDSVKAAVGKNAGASTTGKPLRWQGWPGDAPPPAIAPFDAAQAKAHQEAWAKHLGVPVEYENSIGMKCRLIPPGEFVMGSTPEEIAAAVKEFAEIQDQHNWREWFEGEGPQHKAILTQPVYVGVTEVTQSQYEQVMGTNPSKFSATGNRKDAVAGLETGNYPVENVNWNHAAEFCAKLSQRERLKPFYLRAGNSVRAQAGAGYRLPTEAEWEYACRAGTTTRFWSGDEEKDLQQAGWFNRNSGGRTHDVGELRANPFGLWDMHGNVWEWVQDGGDTEFYGRLKGKVAVDPSRPFSTSSYRVFRGGSWTLRTTLCRSSERGHTSIRSGHAFVVGIRVVLMVDGVKQQLSRKRR